MKKNIDFFTDLQEKLPLNVALKIFDPNVETTPKISFFRSDIKDYMFNHFFNWIQAVFELRPAI